MLAFTPTAIFSRQVAELTPAANAILLEKIQLARENPGRFKRVYYSDLFRIRFSDRGKEKRFIYLIESDRLVALCILDRDKEHKDIEKYL